MHLVYLQNFGITIVFDFSWDDCNTQEKLKTMVMYFFWWGGGGGCEGGTICIMVSVKMVNIFFVSVKSLAALF